MADVVERTYIPMVGTMARYRCPCSPPHCSAGERRSCQGPHRCFRYNSPLCGGSRRCFRYKHRSHRGYSLCFHLKRLSCRWSHCCSSCRCGGIRGATYGCRHVSCLFPRGVRANCLDHGAGGVVVPQKFSDECVSRASWGVALSIRTCDVEGALVRSLGNFDCVGSHALLCCHISPCES